MNTPEKLATQGIQDEGKHNEKNGNMTCDILQTTKGRDELNILTRMEHDKYSGFPQQYS
jgi:hypothetical protein